MSVAIPDFESGGWVTRPIITLEPERKDPPVNWFERPEQEIVPDFGTPETTIPAMSRPAKKRGKLSRLRNWWKTRGPKDISQFAQDVGAVVGQIKAAKQAARAQATTFAQDIREDYDRGEALGRAEVIASTRRQPAGIPWWLWLLLLLLVVAVVVAAIRR